ncbi:RNA polymerase sigma-70 factor [Leifsonia sp. NPDC077715]|uniref:RNA polymerase sigma-70 factor n=1 Tax=Leifsonia sp. NPDC077715 TaxID=3155539 RepID=UPI00343E3AFF
MPGETAQTDDLTAAAETFAAVRSRLFGIAYRMLGTVADAEDIVQDTWERWQGTDRSAVREPAAFLATTATRLAINQAQSARVRRETYIGPWLPEPVDTSADPLLGAERGEALEFAVLVLLESLSPTERAAYVLREAFDYPYAQIADIIQGSEASARQLVSRARKHLAEQRHVREAGLQEQRRMLEAFLEAAQSGDIAELERIFTADIVSYSDGGGLARASRIPVFTRETVAKYVHAFHTRFWDGTVHLVEANGGPAAVLVRDGAVVAFITLDVTTDGIRRLQWVLNPEKLERLPVPA